MDNKVNFVLVLVIAFLSMAVAFIVIFMVMTGGILKPSASNKESGKEAAKVQIDYKKATYYSIPEMIINLKSGGNNPKSIIKVEVAIMLKEKSFEEEFKTRETEIKDIIRSTFNNKTGDDVIDNKIDQVARELLVKVKALYTEKKESDKILKVLIPSAFIQ